MDLGLNDKVAAVTASSLGLGQAIAMELAQEGAKVSICARRQGPLDETRAAIEAAGGDVLSCVADMSKREDIERFVNDTAAHFGRLDILVNNAAMPRWAGPSRIPTRSGSRLTTSISGARYGRRELRYH